MILVVLVGGRASYHLVDHGTGPLACFLIGTCALALELTRPERELEGWRIPWIPAALLAWVAAFATLRLARFSRVRASLSAPHGAASDGSADLPQVRHLVERWKGPRYELEVDRFNGLSRI
ncbi:MAG TPA: hypothetical protein VNO21_05995, partial [Polyangiaceae bacterium]|nr:hypothetical protein [Polyangiaceae bacterium]